MGVSSDEGRFITARRALLAGGLGAAGLALTQLGPQIIAPLTEHDGATGQWADDVAWLVSQGIAKPDAQEPFRADEPVTREEIAVFLYKLAGSPEYPALKMSPYRDVTEKATNVREILWMRGQGIAFGAFDATFRPTERLTRGEMCAFLCRMLRIPLSRHTGTSVPENPKAVAGVPSSHRYAREIGWVSAVGLLPALTDGDAFAPDAELPRGQCAHILRKAEELFA